MLETQLFDISEFVSIKGYTKISGNSVIIHNAENCFTINNESMKLIINIIWPTYSPPSVNEQQHRHSVLGFSTHLLKFLLPTSNNY